MNKSTNKYINKNSSQWSLVEIEDLYRLPYNDLIFKAQTTHKKNFKKVVFGKNQIKTVMELWTIRS